MYTATDCLKGFYVKAGCTAIVSIVILDSSLQLSCGARGNCRNDLVDVEVLYLVVDVDGIRMEQSGIVERREYRLAEKLFRREAVLVWAEECNVQRVMAGVYAVSEVTQCQRTCCAISEVYPTAGMDIPLVPPDFGWVSATDMSAYRAEQHYALQLLTMHGFSLAQEPVEPRAVVASTCEFWNCASLVQFGIPCKLCSLNEG